MKIALIGSAPSSIHLAPYDNPEWEIWGCSPGVYGIARNVKRWFELHRWEPGKPWFSPEYCMWMGKLKVPVMMAALTPDVPMGQVIDVQGLCEKYSPYLFTSSLAWMCAMAIEQIISQPGFKPGDGSAIGFWGVDMAATEEYQGQRLGCQIMSVIAQAHGIEVGVAPESDLFVPAALYGVSEIEHGQIKLLERSRELQGRLADAQNRAAQVSGEINFLTGALEDTKYMKSTWADTGSYVQPFGATVMEKMWAPKAPIPVMVPIDTRGAVPRSGIHPAEIQFGEMIPKADEALHMGDGPAT